MLQVGTILADQMFMPDLNRRAYRAGPLVSLIIAVPLVFLTLFFPVGLCPACDGTGLRTAYWYDKPDDGFSDFGFTEPCDLHPIVGQRAPYRTTLYKRWTWKGPSMKEWK
ncbi:MAG TPA: hypothetical protein VJB14_07545 [Planctomycetota bacterium]|nr:hypothetical protein [Planctomycetota bacterium]